MALPPEAKRLGGRYFGKYYASAVTNKRRRAVIHLRFVDHASSKLTPLIDRVRHIIPRSSHAASQPVAPRHEQSKSRADAQSFLYAKDD